MTTQHTILVLSAGCALAALTGCGTTPASPAPQETTKFTVENTNRFVALDPATEAAVSCTGLQERALADGRIEVVANLKNSAKTVFKVKVQCLFLDDQGLSVSAEAPWQSLEIGADSTEVMRFTAPVIAARRYVIRVRSSR